MHDCKGRLIEEGDVVAAKDYRRGHNGPPDHKGKRSAFKVIGTLPGSESCNMYCLAFGGTYGQLDTLSAKETELLLKHDGSTPAQATEA